HWAADTAAVDYKLDRPGWCAGAGGGDADGRRERHRLARQRGVNRGAQSGARTGRDYLVTAGRRAGAGEEARLTAVAGRDGMRSYPKTGGTEGGSGRSSAGADAYWAPGIAAVDHKLDRPGRRAGARGGNRDGSREGNQLSEDRRIHRSRHGAAR